MKKAILLDLDNTLVDFMKFKAEACEAAVKAMIRHGLRMERGAAMKKLFQMYNKLGIEEGKIFQKFLGEMTGKVDYNILSNAIIAYRKMRFGNLKSYPDVERTLQKLKKKGFKLAIISDAPRLKCWLRLATIGLTDFFDAVVAYEDTGKKKPHHLPFQKALRKLHCGAKEAIMVGDNLSRDIEGAKKMGIVTVYAAYGNPRERTSQYRLVNPHYYTKVNPKIPNGADYTIYSFKEIYNLAKKV